MSDPLRVKDNIRWLIELWEEIPEPTLEDRVKAVCMLYAELESMF